MQDAFSILDATDIPSRGMIGDNTQHQENINKIKIKRVLAEIKGEKRNSTINNKNINFVLYA